MKVHYPAPNSENQANWGKLESHADLATPELFEHAVRNGEGKVVFGYNLAVTTNPKRRDSDARYIVVQDGTTDAVWWKHYNPLEEAKYLALRGRVYDHLGAQQNLYSAFCTMGNTEQGFRFNVASPLAWYTAVARKLFYTPRQQKSHASWWVLHAPDFVAIPEQDGTKTERAIIINFSTQEILIMGTSYAGELKTALHSATTYFFPPYDLLPLHAACNIAPDGTDGLAIVGLSGNGKSTTVNDPKRHIYADDLVVVDVTSGRLVPLETGCHVKVHGLSTQDPLYDVITRIHGGVFENVEVSERRDVLLHGGNTSSNGRVSFPLTQHPRGARVYKPVMLRNIVFLCADVTGVIPLVAKLTTPQAMYMFLNAPAARNVGVLSEGSHPELKFATCYGPEFLTVDPLVHADLLRKLCEERGVQCWLVNTGWDGNGVRLPVRVTRAAVRAIAHGGVSEEMIELPVTGLNRPLYCEGVEEHRLDPQAFWPDDETYLEKAQWLAEQFRLNAARKFGRDLSRWVYQHVGALAPTESDFDRYPNRG